MFLHFVTLWLWPLTFWRNINWWARTHNPCGKFGDRSFSRLVFSWVHVSLVSLRLTSHMQFVLFIYFQRQITSFSWTTRSRATTLSTASTWKTSATTSLSTRVQSHSMDMEPASACTAEQVENNQNQCYFCSLFHCYSSTCFVYLQSFSFRFYKNSRCIFISVWLFNSYSDNFRVCSCEWVSNLFCGRFCSHSLA